MIPEIEFTCNGEKHFLNSITTEQYKRYIVLMEKNTSERSEDAIYFNKRIVQELFGNKFSMGAIGEMDIIEFMTASKTIHFIMQQIIGDKLLNMVAIEPVEKEESAFDEYDRENGYEEENQEENQWKVCSEILDRVVKIAIRLLNNSFSQCMKEEIVNLLDYLKYELDTVNEN